MDEDDVEESSHEADDDEEVSDDESDDEDVEEDEEENDTAPVDPAFRQRVAEALGMNIENEPGAEDSDEDDDDVWDDDQMMKIDNQLAEVFRQHAGSSTKRADLKRKFT